MGASVDLAGAQVERAGEGLTPYSWRGVCRVPGCRRPATDPHHVIPRGRLGGPVRYVLLDGQVIPNVAGICRRHHDKLTDGRSLIRWDGAWWVYVSDVREVVMLPFSNQGVIEALGGKHCPCCGRPAPKANPYENRARDRRRVAVDVPADSENGAEILEHLTSQVGELLGLDNTATPSARYYTLTAALADVLQRAPRPKKPATSGNGGPAAPGIQPTRSSRIASRPFG